MLLLAKIISVILHPIVIVLSGVYVVVLGSTYSKELAALWTLYSGIFAVILGIFVIYGVKKGFFNNLDVSNRKQRFVLYSFSILIATLFGLFVFVASGPVSLIYACILFIGALAAFDLINRKIKASIHVASITALATGVVYAYGVAFLPIFILPVISGWSRIIAKRHTVKEVIAGGIAGVLLTIISIIVVRLLMIV